MEGQFSIEARDQQKPEETESQDKGPKTAGEGARVPKEEGIQELAFACRFELIHDLATGQLSLYDLEADPGEREDVAGRHPERVRSLDFILRDWMLHNERHGAPPPSVEITPDERARLDELGYVE